MKGFPKTSFFETILMYIHMCIDTHKDKTNNWWYRLRDTIQISGFQFQSEDQERDKNASRLFLSEMSSGSLISSLPIKHLFSEKNFKLF